MSDSNKYCLVFQGEISEGKDIESVKQGVAAIYKGDLKKVDHLFSNKRTIILKGKDLKSCEKIKNVFMKAGAICRIEIQEEDLSLSIPPVSG